MVNEGFGVGERLPVGLAWQFNEVTGIDVLYILGKENRTLFYLNPEQGRAYSVSNSDIDYDLGIEVKSPADLTSHKGTLYMVDDDNGALATVDTVDGRATPVPEMQRLDPNGRLPKGIASYNEKLYIVCEKRGTVNAPVYDKGKLPQSSQPECVLYELTGTKPQERINISQFVPGVWSSGLFVINKMLCMATQNSSLVYILDVENSRVIEMRPANTPAQLAFPRFPNMRADTYGKCLYVVGREENARLKAINEKGQDLLSAPQ